MEVVAITTEHLVSYFHTFGYLRLPGLFADRIEKIEAAFEQVFDDERHPRVDLGDVPIHRHEPRTMIPGFIDLHPVLTELRTDPDLLDIVGPLLGRGFEYAESDGNLFSCDTEWHCDIYGSPMHLQHLKVSFYLDPVRGDSGAPRVIPGTNHWRDEYASALRNGIGDQIGDTATIYGVDGRDMPSVVLESDPGDVLIWDYRTIHASYDGGPRRRLFTMNFRQPTADDQPV